MDRTVCKDVTATLLRAGRRGLAAAFVSAFFGRAPPATIPESLRPYADMAAPFGGTLFAHAPNRVYFWFESEKQREQFRRKHKRHFAEREMYPADRRLYELKDATQLSRPGTDHLLWGWTA
jgi:hypothetical protein